MRGHSRYTGFTIVELLIVIVIIAILAAITVVAYTGIQQQARDSQRLADLSVLEKAFRLYAVEHGRFPAEASGVNGVIGEGGAIDAILTPYISSVPHDPLGPGNSTYNYYYDGKHNCGGQSSKAVLFIRVLEQPRSDNAVCTSWGNEGGSDNSAAYHIVLGDGPD